MPFAAAQTQTVPPFADLSSYTSSSRCPSGLYAMERGSLCFPFQLMRNWPVRASQNLTVPYARADDHALAVRAEGRAFPFIDRRIDFLAVDPEPATLLAQDGYAGSIGIRLVVATEHGNQLARLGVKKPHRTELQAGCRHGAVPTVYLPNPVDDRDGHVGS